MRAAVLIGIFLLAIAACTGARPSARDTPDDRQRLKDYAAAAQVAFDAAFQRVTALETAGDWFELERVRSRSARLARRVQALRTGPPAASR